MKTLLRNAILLAAFGCFSLQAFAGVVIKREGGEPGGPEKQKSTLYVEGGKIRMEMESERGKTIMIFDGDKQVLWMIQADHTYMEMTAETVQRMSQMQSQMAGQGNPQMEQAMKAMQEKMANMTPEQRAMVEQAMKGRGGAMGGGSASAPPTITYEAKGGSDKIGQFTCTKYDQLSNGKRTAEMCAAPFSQLHLNEGDMRAFHSMAKFMEPMRRMNPRGASAAPTEEIHGFPVHTVVFTGEKPIYEETVLSVEQRSVEASMFVLPAGLTKRDFPGFGGGTRPPR
jgi:hypothetical protein